MNRKKLSYSNVVLFLLIIMLLIIKSSVSLYAKGKKDLPATTSETTVPEELPAPVPQLVDGNLQRIAYKHDLPEGDSVAFHEVWAYLVEGNESDYEDSMPITDLCYFGASINLYGELSSCPSVSKIQNFKGRKHLVVTCDNKSTAHFILDPEFSLRKKLIRDLVAAASKYDGLQIDFELIPPRDNANFQTFISDLRQSLGQEKWFSVALPARVRTLSNDAFNYSVIEKNVDRIIVMAYDEHWSGSRPGPIASMDWCDKVATYAASVIPAKKLVMGLPFYGRTWESENYASAWRFRGINESLNNNNTHVINRDDSVIPSFTFSKEITVTGYFEDTYSLVSRCRMYSAKNVAKVAFWRIGQEDKSFWDWLELN